ncbi:MAG: efflux RND transporter periplasmic adaptor subunit [Paludibacteraceae bacterium]|nr:efflux RND transporter periplasmic adaptor subunit [Paludibacteraceae bacterium]
MKMNVRIIATILGIAAFSVSCSSKKDAQTEEKERVENVRTMTLQKTEVNRELELSTTLEAYEKVAIAPTLQGHIRQILVDVGSKVSAGQLLVKMDETAYIQAKLNVENLKKDFDRVSRLNESDNISKQTYDQTKAQYDIQKESLDNLLTNTYVKAPFSGVITEKNYENGELYTGSPILTLMQISTLKAYVNIPESYFPYIKEGMSVNLTSNIYEGKKFDAKIETIYPTIDASTHTFKVKVKVPNGRETLRPGMYVYISLNFGKVSAMVVPYQSVLKLQGSNNRYIFVNENGHAKRIDVQMGQRFDDQVEIISDEVNNGSEIIVVGQARLVDGVKLNIMNEE